MSTRYKTVEQADKERSWVLFDASQEPVGRMATKVAAILRGKNNPAYAPHTDCGDFVVVVNAEKCRFTGKKMQQKTYYHHTGYIGGIRKETASELRDRAPEEVVYRAVKGMMPSTNLGRRQLKKLKVYAGAEHPHSAQLTSAPVNAPGDGSKDSNSEGSKA